MSHDPIDVRGMDSGAKRELLARLLRERAAISAKPFRLSLGQEALWFLHQLAPDSAAYNVSFCVRLGSEVDNDRLESALRKLMERHSILRSTFLSIGDEPWRQVGSVPEHCLERIDATGWSESELLSEIRNASGRPFDLTSGPVCRSTLFMRRDARQILLISAHHIVIDAWSSGVIINDLGVLYDTGTADRLPPKGASYASFVRWQRTMIESLEGQTAWHYWRSQLDSLKAIDLPADHTSEEIGSSPGATFEFALPAALVLQIRELAQIEKTTAFVVLAAAFHSLLHRYTGAPKIQFGTPFAGRSQPEFENTVGYFVNPVVLSASVKPDTTFRRHLAIMREVIVAALQYGDFPFPEIVKRLRPERHAGRTPLFQVMLNLNRTRQGNAEGQILQGGSGVFRSGSLELEAFPIEQHEAQFDLDLMLLDTGPVVQASLKYRTDLFEADTVERLAQDFSALLAAAMTDPDRRISDFPLSAKARIIAAETEREEFAI